jgi:hypothetical protein
VGIPTLVQESFFLADWATIDDDNVTDYNPKLLVRSTVY